jgi:hypothetical protein
MMVSPASDERSRTVVVGSATSDAPVVATVISSRGWLRLTLWKEPVVVLSPKRAVLLSAKK